MVELFELQDEITKKIVVSLQVELTHGEQARAYAKTTDNLEAWSYGVRGNCLLDKFNREDNIKARDLLETAIKLDPGYVLAYVWLGATHTSAAAYGWVDSPADSFKRVDELAQKALALDDKNPSVHVMLALNYLFQREHDKAIAEGELAISLDPNFSIAHAHLAQIRRYEDALASSKQLHDRSRRDEYPEDWALVNLAGDYAASDRQDEARTCMAQALKINLGLSMKFFKQTQPFKNPAHLQRELEALIRAGFPQHAP
jgi:adenylate cyclase